MCWFLFVGGGLGCVFGGVMPVVVSGILVWVVRFGWCGLHLVGLVGRLVVRGWSAGCTGGSRGSKRWERASVGDIHWF
jgi:hypothetical protein